MISGVWLGSREGTLLQPWLLLEGRVLPPCGQVDKAQLPGDLKLCSLFVELMGMIGTLSPVPG